MEEKKKGEHDLETAIAVNIEVQWENLSGMLGF